MNKPLSKKIRELQIPIKFQDASIQKKFSFGLIGVVTLILLIFSFGIIFYNAQSLEEDLQERLTDISTLSALTIPNAVWQFNTEYINDFVNSISLYKDIVYIRVLTKDRAITTKSHLKLLDKKYSDFQNSPDYIVKETKIIHNEFEIGWVQIVMTRERIKQLIINNSIMSIGLISIVIMAIFITNLLLSRKFLFEPLSKLEQSTKFIAEGDLNTKIDTTSSDEIGKLAKSFSRMIKSIKSITASRDALDDEIREREHAQEMIKTTLGEKEVLLREIHHRVKNNMQVIVSLLSLQEQKAKNKKFSAMFKESQNRINAMSLVHEKLYRSRNLADIDFGQYVKSFIDTLSESYDIGVNKILITTKIENISFDLENAIPCGLIINELVSNALKYAFPDGREGKIKITLNSITEEDLELIVKDNGIGLPKEFDINNIDTLGLELTKSIVEHQLDGEIKIDQLNGTLFHIIFKHQKYKTRI